MGHSLKEKLAILIYEAYQNPVEQPNQPDNILYRADGLFIPPNIESRNLVRLLLDASDYIAEEFINAGLSGIDGIIFKAYTVHLADESKKLYMYVLPSN